MAGGVVKAALAGVEEVHDGRGVGVAVGERGQIPLGLDGGQDRCVVMHDVGDRVRLGVRRGDDGGHPRPVDVVAPGTSPAVSCGGIESGGMAAGGGTWS